MPAMLLVNTMKKELSLQQIEMLLFLTTNTAAMMSRANQQFICKCRSEIDKQCFRDDSVPKRRNLVEDLLS